jgi:hypothetical protein
MLRQFCNGKKTVHKIQSIFPYDHFTLFRNDKVDDHCSPSGKSRLRPNVEVVDRVGTHEGHLNGRNHRFFFKVYI